MNVIKHVTIFLVFFYYTFLFYFSFIPDYISYFIANFLPLIYLLLNREYLLDFWARIPKKKYVYFSGLFYFSALIWALITIAYNMSNDFSYIKYLLYILRNVYVALFLGIILSKFSNRGSLLERYFKFYIASCCLYIIITIIMFFYPEIKSFWRDMIIMDNIEIQETLIENAAQQTRFGLKGFSGFLETIQCTIAVIFCSYFIKNNKVIGLVPLPLLILGNLLYGRIGIILSILIIIATLMRNISIKIFIHYLSIFIAIIVIAIIELNLIEDNIFIDAWWQWVMEPINSFLEGLSRGYVTFGTSIDLLINQMYFMPSDDKTLFFGDGYYTSASGGYYMKTDAGIMRAMLFYGIIGEFFGYMSLLLLTYLSRKVFMLNNNRLGAFVSSCLLFIFVICELKGDLYKIFFAIIPAIIFMYLSDVISLSKKK